MVIALIVEVCGRLCQAAIVIERADLTTTKPIYKQLNAFSINKGPLLTTLSVSQPLTTIAELTQLCKANTLTNTPLSTAYHT